jgi:hypothetical protein
MNTHLRFRSFRLYAGRIHTGRHIPGRLYADFTGDNRLIYPGPAAFFYASHAVKLPLPHSGTFKPGLSPGGGGNNDRIPKGKGPALQGPAGVHHAALLPKNTIIIGPFLKGKILNLLTKGHPAAPGRDKLPLLHGLSRRQSIQILPGKEDVTALITAAGRAAFTAKTKPLRVKRLSHHVIKITLYHKNSYNSMARRESG